LLIVILYPIDVYIMDGSIYGISHLLTKSACLLLVFIEALSVDENIRAINKDKGVEFYFKKLIFLIGVKGGGHKKTASQRKRFLSKTPIALRNCYRA